MRDPQAAGSKGGELPLPLVPLVSSVLIASLNVTLAMASELVPNASSLLLSKVSQAWW